MLLKRKPSFSVVVLLCLCISISFTVHYAAGFQCSVNVPPTSLTSLFAKAKGGSKKRKQNKASPKGFGAPPPTLDDVLAEFKTRVPDDADRLTCPCGAGAAYADCCRPLHRGDRACLTMTDVLRSRYTAFSWRIIEHVMNTTHPTCRDHRPDRVAWAKDLHKNGMFDSFEFVKLEIGKEESGPNENEGFVDFKVTLKAKEGGSGAGQETVISEKSRFLRDPKDGSWSYASGDVRSQVAGLEETTLNV